MAVPNRRLPFIQEEIEKLITSTDLAYAQLPPACPRDPMLAIHRLISVLSREIERALDGTPERDGLIQLLRADQDEFASAIWRSAPDFKPCKDTTWDKQKLGTYNSVKPALPAPDFLSKEEQQNFYSNNHLQITYKDVLERAQRYIVITRTAYEDTHAAFRHGLVPIALSLENSQTTFRSLLPSSLSRS
jgi:hypothetical protein